ncbi:MAG: hypothetical protein NZ580_08570, partial [Bacteroidia bacterium]|nr:hypothetical protein [Bacteroidia bacterium]
NAAQRDPNPLRLPFTLTTRRNFLLLEVEGPPTHRQIRIKAFSAQGDMLWEHLITAQELKPQI